MSAVSISALSADFQKGLEAAKRGDYATALSEWRPLGEQGHFVAQYNLGLMHENATGVTQDFKKAAAWYRRAADQGYAIAQFNLGDMYLNGRGVAQDHRSAEYWYKLAAEQAHAQAQLKLGFLYVRGDASLQDFTRAHMWFTIADSNGAGTAGMGRIIVEELMTADQIAEAQKRAREWIGRHRK